MFFVCADFDLHTLFYLRRVGEKVGDSHENNLKRSKFMESKTKFKSAKRLTYALLFISTMIALFMATAMQSSASDYYSGDWGYELNSANTAVLTYYYGSESGNLVIPSKIDSYTVVGLDDTFYDDYFKSVTIPETVTSLGEGTFFDCYIEDLYLPKSLFIVEDDAFYEAYVDTIHYAGSLEEWVDLMYDYEDIDYFYYDYIVYGHTHTYAAPKVTRKATTSQYGYITYACTSCSYSFDEYIPYISSISLEKTSYTYNGKVKKPAVNIYDINGNRLKSGTDYTVKYASGRKNIGKYKVTVTFKGNYSGTKTLYFTIGPKTPSLKSLKYNGVGKMTVNYSQIKKGNGYQIQYAENSLFDKAKTKNIKKADTLSATLSGLKKNTVYYVRVRSYKTVSDKKYYSEWSDVKCYINTGIGYERYIYPQNHYTFSSRSSSDKNIVQCLQDSDGYYYLKAKGLGEATISLKTKAGTIKYCYVYVTFDDIYVFKGTTVSLPGKINGKSVSWSSNGNKSIATVSSGSKVKGVKAGITTLTYKSSGITYSADVKVVDYDALYKKAKNHRKDSLIVPDAMKIYHVWRGYDKYGYPIIVIDYGGKYSDGNTWFREYYVERSWYNDNGKLKYDYYTTSSKPTIKNGTKMK